MIRECLHQDRGHIQALLNIAFSPSLYESRLREIIVDSGERYFERLVEIESKVVAYILYTPATNGAAEIGYHLAPVAVHPDFQRQGLGSSLIRETLSLLCDEAIFVLGDPRYYERFGFIQTITAQCPFDEGNKHFRSIRWSDEHETFSIGYSSAFKKAEQVATPGES